MAADDGEVAGVVFGRVLLFIGGFVFLIDDDESGIFDGGEDGRAGPDDDAGFASSDAVPFVEAFALGKVRVEDGGLIDEVVKAGFETLDGLRRESDFGNKDDDVFSEVEGGAGGLKVDFGLAGAGDAVEEDRSGFVGVEAFDDGLVNLGLFSVEGEGIGGDEGFVGVRVASDFEVDKFDPAFFGKGFEGSGGGGAAEVGDGDGFVGDGKESDDLVLAFGALGEGGEFFFGRRIYKDRGTTGFGGGFFATD